jgi:hypothetical protein
MTNVRKYNDSQILTKIESLESFKGWKKGIYDIWIRSNEDEYDSFDDKVYTYECMIEGERPKFIMLCSGTTNPGSQGLKKFEGWNKKGCAVACGDVIVYNSHIYGLHGKSKYPAYIQSFKVGFPYTRDNDKDSQSENYGKIYTDRIGLNVHRAVRIGVTKKITVHSVACLVRNDIEQWKKWLEFMDKRSLSVAILKEFEA